MTSTLAPDQTQVLLDAVRRGIQAAPGSGRPEATLRAAVQPVLSTILRELGLRAGARDEARLVVPTGEEAHLLDAPLSATGRADAIYNRFVIEFEPPGALRPSVQHSATRHAVSQVQQYLRGLNHESGIPMDRLAGCAFDGHWIVYVSWERGTWVVGRPMAVDLRSLASLVEALASLAVGRGLTAGNLDEDFGRGSDLAASAVRALFAPLSGDWSPRTRALFDQWATDQGIASGPFSLSDAAEWRDLTRSLGLPPTQEAGPRVLFALQTYFSLVAKLVSLVVLEGATGLPLVSALRSPGRTTEAYRLLESGSLTAGTQATNAVEPGVFSWYAFEKGPALTEFLQAAANLAAEYSGEVVEIAPAVAHDLMKDLYQRLLPPTIRHRMGEYYTPDWLAQRVVNQVTGSQRDLPSTRRVLDPACGSGTFLTEAISRMIASSFDDDPASTLERIVQNVVGFDLSPLAVQASKVNYLLAIAPLLRSARNPIVIPVFLSDSVAPPRRGGLLEGDVYLFESSEGAWQVPAPLADAHFLPQLGAVLREAISGGHGDDWVTHELEARVPLSSSEDAPVFDAVLSLFRKLGDLERADRNGMWWPLVSNAFAPTLHGRFDYIVGNPPWVSWETLPEAYRRDNDEQWMRYGLRPDTPPDRRQASTNVRLDLAMLFVSRCMERYLQPDGRLGFVITASVFQSELAGRGFRRRLVPESGRTYRFAHIDDMTSLAIFEGVANRTAVLIADHRDQDGLIPVVRWEASVGNRSVPPKATLQEVGDRTARRHLHAEPVDPSDPASPLLILPRSGLVASRAIRRQSAYLARVREGINTRGANGIFFVEVLGIQDSMVQVRNVAAEGRLSVPIATGWVERDAVRQLLRGGDVGRASASPVLGLLFFHDEEHVSYPLTPTEAADRFPHAVEYISRFEDLLRNRRPFRNFDPRGDGWLGLYSVTTACLAPEKVVVREIAQGMVAAAVHGADVIPDHKLYVIPTASAAEADRLTEALNSDVVDWLVRSFAISTSLAGSFLRYVGIQDLSDMAGSSDPARRIADALGISQDDYRELARIASGER